MKHLTPESMKFKKLQRRLGVSAVVVAGTLEFLWIATQKNAKRGDIGQFSNEEIAIECGWEGDPDAFIEALIDCGWLDVCDTCRLVVNSWDIISRDYREPIGRRPDLGTAAWKRIRLEVIAEDGSVCFYCGCGCQDDPTVDHVIPYVRGGTIARTNLVVACRSCNGRKGDR